ncbi:sigma-70 family RNA polymerase sigma factor [Thiogranum longum]|nr:sigma-70 family RNA polymerase sigma factor [Thiogranum longum]
MKAWNAHENELRAWLRRRLGSQTDAEDMLQDLFLKAMRQDQRFCQLDNARAWLFQVARNALADRLRLSREQVALPEDLASDSEEPVAIASMAACLPRALSELNEEDRDALSHCDLEGMKQKDYANQKNISLPAVKSRVQRARRRLRAHLTEACQVRFDEAGKVCCFEPRSKKSN